MQEGLGPPHRCEPPGNWRLSASGLQVPDDVAAEEERLEDAELEAEDDFLDIEVELEEEDTVALPVPAYEINIRVEHGDYVFSIDHSHPTLPDVELVVSLKDEACRYFSALYPQAGDPDDISVHMNRSNGEFGPPEELELIIGD